MANIAQALAALVAGLGQGFAETRTRAQEEEARKKEREEDRAFQAEQNRLGREASAGEAETQRSLLLQLEGLRGKRETEMAILKGKEQEHLGTIADVRQREAEDRAAAEQRQREQRAEQAQIRKETREEEAKKALEGRETQRGLQLAAMQLKMQATLEGLKAGRERRLENTKAQTAYAMQRLGAIDAKRTELAAMIAPNLGVELTPERAAEIANAFKVLSEGPDIGALFRQDTAEADEEIKALEDGLDAAFAAAFSGDATPEQVASLLDRALEPAQRAEDREAETLKAATADRGGIGFAGALRGLGGGAAGRGAAPPEAAASEELGLDEKLRQIGGRGGTSFESTIASRSRGVVDRLINEADAYPTASHARATSGKVVQTASQEKLMDEARDKLRSVVADFFISKGVTAVGLMELDKYGKELSDYLAAKRAGAYAPNSRRFTIEYGGR